MPPQRRPALVDQPGPGYQIYQPGGGYQQWQVDPRGPEYPGTYQGTIGPTAPARGATTAEPTRYTRGGGAYGAVTGPRPPVTTTTVRGPETVTERPWDPNLYQQLLGDVERFRTQAGPDITAAQEQLATRLGLRATAGLGVSAASPLARAARIQALEPFYARMGTQAADRYLRQQALLGQMGRGLLTPYGIRETTGRTDVRTTGEGEGPFQTFGRRRFAGYGQRGGGVYI